MAEPADHGVDDHERVARFVYDSDKVSRVGGVKPGAFLPMLEKGANRLETSVCRLVGCSEERVWHLGTTQRPDRTLYARADHSLQAAIANNLSCVSAPVDGFPEHAVLLGWPSEKPAQKLIAIALSKVSTTVFPISVVPRPP